MASTEVLTASEFSTHGSTFLGHGATWYSEASHGFKGGKSSVMESRHTDTRALRQTQSSNMVFTDETFLQGPAVASSGQDSSRAGFSNLPDSILLVRTGSQPMPGVQLQESHVVSWSSGTLRCRDVHCSSKISDGFMSTSCPVMRGKALPRLGNNPDSNPSTLRTLPAESTKRTGSGSEFDSLSPTLKAVHEGMVALGQSQLNEFSTLKLDFSPRRSTLDSETSGMLCLSDLLQDRIQNSAQESLSLQKRINSCTDVLSLSDSCPQGFPRAGSEGPCQDPFRGIGTPQMSREDDGETEGEERALLLSQGILPRARSILIVKTVDGQPEEGRERGSKTVRWRDGQGDTLTAVREFEVSDQPELYDDFLNEDEGFCSCCTVS